MLFAAEHGPVDKKLLLQFAKQFSKSQKIAMPKRLEPGPELYPGLDLFYDAFWDLTTERPAETAPIPWSRIQQWAVATRLSGDQRALLHGHIRAMDLAFLGWRRDKQGRTKSPPKPEEGQNGKPVRPRPPHGNPRR